MVTIKTLFNIIIRTDDLTENELAELNEGIGLIKNRNEYPGIADGVCFFGCLVSCMLFICHLIINRKDFGYGNEALLLPYALGSMIVISIAWGIIYWLSSRTKMKLHREESTRKINLLYEKNSRFKQFYDAYVIARKYPAPSCNCSSQD